MQIQTIFPKDIEANEVWELFHVLDFFVERASNLVIAAQCTNKQLKQLNKPFEVTIRDGSPPSIIIHRTRLN
jgi:hypothetical protein